MALRLVFCAKKGNKSQCPGARRLIQRAPMSQPSSDRCDAFVTDLTVFSQSQKKHPTCQTTNQGLPRVFEAGHVSVLSQNSQ